MNDTTQTRIASALTTILGVWLLLSPLFITITGGALVSTLLAGGILALTGAIEFFWENTIPSWISGLTAAWMAISTVTFGMADGLLWSTFFTAIATLFIAIWDGIEVSKIARQHHTQA